MQVMKEEFSKDIEKNQIEILEMKSLVESLTKLRK
jgi:hypothetical protein